ncbi:hypothetical protein ACC754_41015, partial [Rhizobium johnstonii]
MRLLGAKDHPHQFGASGPDKTAEQAHSGKIFLHGRKVHINNPRAAVKAGIGIVHESRKEQGLVLDFPIRVNATMSRLG